MSYEPRGKTKALIDAMAPDPKRIWSAEEAAKAMGVAAFRSTLLAYTDSACRNGTLFRRMVAGGALQFRLTAFDLEEASAWKVPQMVPPRGTPAPAPPVGKAEVKLEKIRADIAADMEPRGERANRVLVDKLQEAMPQWNPPAAPDRSLDAHLEKIIEGQDKIAEGKKGIAEWLDRKVPPGSAADLRPCASSQTDSKCLTAAPTQPTPAAADASLPEAASAEPALTIELDAPLDEQQQEEAAEPLTWAHWDDGDLDLFGLVELENGGHRIQAKDVARLRRMLAWLPA